MNKNQHQSPNLRLPVLSYRNLFGTYLHKYITDHIINILPILRITDDNNYGRLKDNNCTEVVEKIELNIVIICCCNPNEDICASLKVHKNCHHIKKQSMEVLCMLINIKYFTAISLILHTDT